MKTIIRLISKAPVLFSALLMMTAIGTMYAPCGFFWGQPKMPEKLRQY
jgi:cyclic lactone autoinducer peptide